MATRGAVEAGPPSTIAGSLCARGSLPGPSPGVTGCTGVTLSVLQWEGPGCSSLGCQGWRGRKAGPHLRPPRGVTTLWAISATGHGRAGDIGSGGSRRV